MAKQNVVGVQFEENGKVYYFAPQNLEFKKGQRVIVETSHGIDMGIVSMPKLEVDDSEFLEPLKNVVRIANEKDLSVVEKLKEKSKNALKVSREQAKKLNLEMSICDAEYTFDESKLIVLFTADDRVDFRELVKNLASSLHTRIELRQVGVRDEAKMVGGIGPCGREVCCRKFLNDFEKVSIKMAKNQGISLNPTSINGVCGRLMCCLSYENDAYVELLKNMPKLNAKVKTKEGIGNVVYNDLLKQIVSVKIKRSEEDFDIVDFPVSEIEVLEGNNNGQQN